MSKVKLAATLRFYGRIIFGTMIELVRLDLLWTLPNMVCAYEIKVIKRYKWMFVSRSEAQVIFDHELYA